MGLKFSKRKQVKKKGKKPRRKGIKYEDLSKITLSQLTEYKRNRLDSFLWDIFSLYIRIRDSLAGGNIMCITCGRIKHWSESDAGHCISRGDKATKYNEQNVHAQCKYCNAFRGGRAHLYAKIIDRRYGKGSYQKLEDLSQIKGCKYTSLWYADMILEYIKKLTKIAKEKDVDLQDKKIYL